MIAQNSTGQHNKDTTLDSQKRSRTFLPVTSLTCWNAICCVHCLQRVTLGQLGARGSPAPYRAAGETLSASERALETTVMAHCGKHERVLTRHVQVRDC